MIALRKHFFKLVALIFSLFLWAYVLSTAKIQLEKQVRVDYLSPEGLVLANIVPREITYVIETPRAFIKGLSERDDRLVIDLSKVKNSFHAKNRYRIDFKTSELKLPFGARVLQVLPKSVDLEVEREMKRTVPVFVNWDGSLEERSVLRAWQVYPPSVEVRGPRSLIEQLKFVETRSVKLEDLKGRSTLKLSIPFIDDRLLLLENEVLLTRKTGKQR